MRAKKCLCCNEGEVEAGENTFDICPICGWEDDGVQADDPDYAGGANILSLNEHRKEFFKKRKRNPNYSWTEEAIDKVLSLPTVSKKTKEHFKNIKEYRSNKKLKPFDDTDYNRMLKKEGLTVINKDGDVISPENDLEPDKR